MIAVDGLLLARQPWPAVVALERRAAAAAGALRALVGEGHHVRAVQGVDAAVAARGAQLMRRAG